GRHEKPDVQDECQGAGKRGRKDGHKGDLCSPDHACQSSLPELRLPERHVQLQYFPGSAGSTTKKVKRKTRGWNKGPSQGLLSASLVGSVDHSRLVENTANRGGSLEVKIHVSESGMPPGLQKIINALVENIEVPVREPQPKLQTLS